MKRLPAQKQTFQKFRSYELGHIKKKIDKRGQMIWSQMYIKILGVHFVSSVFDSNNWDIKIKTSSNKHD